MNTIIKPKTVVNIDPEIFADFRVVAEVRDMDQDEMREHLVTNLHATPEEVENSLGMAFAHGERWLVYEAPDAESFVHARAQDDFGDDLPAVLVVNENDPAMNFQLVRSDWIDLAHRVDETGLVWSTTKDGEDDTITMEAQHARFARLDGMDPIQAMIAQLMGEI